MSFGGGFYGEETYGGGITTHVPTFPNVSVEVAFPNDLFDVSKTWTDISDLTEAIKTSIGRRRELERAATGTAELTLGNPAGVFDPVDPGSPYDGELLPRKAVRVIAEWDGVDYPLFSGHIEDWQPDYQEPSTTVPCADWFALLAGEELTQSPYAYEVAADNPKAWWRLGDVEDLASTTVAGDSAATGAFPGVYGGGIQFGQQVAPWDSSPGVTLDGSGRIDMPSAASLTGEFVIEGTFKTTTEGPALGVMTMLSQGESFLYGPGGFYESTRGIQIGVGESGRVFADYGGARLVSDTSYTDGRPHLVTIIWDGALFQLILDGVPQYAILPSNTAPKPIAQISLGAPIDSNPFMTNWVGGLKDWVFYDHALTPARVAERHAAWVGGWRGDTSGQRINRLLDLIGLPTASDRAVQGGNSTLAGTHLGTTALEELHKINDTEDGLLYVAGDGDLTFVERHARLFAPYTESQATFYDDDPSNPVDALMYETVDPARPVDAVRNIVDFVPQGGNKQGERDAASVAKYGPRTYSKQTLHESDNAALDAVNWILLRYADPDARVRSITLTPYGQEARIWPQILGRRIGDRITVVRHLLSGAELSHECHIEGITHDFDADGRWVTTWLLSPADNTTFGVLDDPVLGVLDSTTRLAS